ncbi:hypothetical protein AB205_0097640 [Aquarana catesbeiana]|uniref:Uncharacterized protein n=1 Tax=Aquarana catesbeiana TaxID=8400 RepID=A0A2G9RZH9_AQUCT|nr:hypothetical protein AB205_0097640 [Aquarana catesbeiana]
MAPLPANYSTVADILLISPAYLSSPVQRSSAFALVNITETLSCIPIKRLAWLTSLLAPDPACCFTTLFSGSLTFGLSDYLFRFLNFGYVLTTFVLFTFIIKQGVPQHSNLPRTPQIVRCSANLRTANVRVEHEFDSNSKLIPSHD